MFRIYSLSLVVLTIVALVGAAPLSNQVEERDAPKPAQYWRVASPAYKRAEKPASDWWRVAYPAYKRDASEPSKDWQPSFPPFKRDAPEAAQDWRVASPAY